MLPDSFHARERSHPGSARTTTMGTKHRPEDAVIRWRWPIAALTAGGTAYAVSLLLSRSPRLADAYAAGLGPALSRPLSRLTGMVPFSVADILVALYAGWLLFVSARAIRAALRKRRRGRNVLASGVRTTARDGGILVTLFYVLWGWNYAGRGFAERAGWPDWEGIPTAELIALTETATAAANQAYRELHGTDDVGRPTTVADDPLALDAALGEGWQHVADRLDLPDRFTARYGPVKQPLASAVLVRVGVVGIYVPFTAEANILRGMPPVGAATSMAHEQAHQRGVTGEGDASFLGFMAAALAPGSLARYSAAVWAQGRLASALARVDRDAWRRLAEDRLPGVRRDLEDLTRFMSRTLPLGQRLQTALNDRYLRANRVRGGVQNYGLSTRLLITFARQNDGRVMPAPP